MGFFSRGYEPGGKHHVRISDDTFSEAQKRLAEDSAMRSHAKALAAEEGVGKYEAHDFPVTEILGTFILAYELQELKNGVPENLRISNIQLGRKDQVEYQKFVEKFNASIEEKVDRHESRWSRMGLGAKLLSAATSAAASGVARAATGKSKDVREFDNHFCKYICGDSEQARTYLLKFAAEFGGDDDGVLDVAKAIRRQFWIAEFAKYNRSK